MGGKGHQSVKDLWAAAFTSLRSLSESRVVAGFENTRELLRDLKSSPDTDKALEELWIFAAYTGLYSHAGHDWMQFVAARSAPCTVAIASDAPTRALKVAGRRIRSILRIQHCWPRAFVYELRGRGIRLPPEPACTFLETLAAIAQHQPTIDDFIRCFPPFLNKHMLNARHNKKDLELHAQRQKNVSLADLKAYLNHINTQHTSSPAQTPHLNPQTAYADVSSSLMSPVSVECARRNSAAGTDTDPGEGDDLDVEDEEQSEEVADSSLVASPVPFGCSDEAFSSPLADLNQFMARERDDGEEGNQAKATHQTDSSHLNELQHIGVIKDNRIDTPHEFERSELAPMDDSEVAHDNSCSTPKPLSEESCPVPSLKRRRLETPPAESRLYDTRSFRDQRAQNRAPGRFVAKSKHVGTLAPSPFLYHTRSTSQSNPGAVEPSYVQHPDMGNLQAALSGDAVGQGHEANFNQEVRVADDEIQDDYHQTGSEIIKNVISGAERHSRPSTYKPPNETSHRTCLHELAPGQWLSTNTIDHLTECLLPDTCDHRWYDPGNMATHEAQLAPITGDRFQGARIVFVRLCLEGHWILFQYNIPDALRNVCDSKIGHVSAERIRSCDAKLGDAIWQASSRTGPPYWAPARCVEVVQQRNNDDCGVHLLVHALVGASGYLWLENRKPPTNPILWRFAFRQIVQFGEGHPDAFGELVDELGGAVKTSYRPHDQDPDMSLAGTKLAEQQVADLLSEVTFAGDVVTASLEQAQVRQERLTTQQARQGKLFDDDIAAFKRVMTRLSSWPELTPDVMARGRQHDLKTLESDRDRVLRPIARDLKNTNQSIPNLQRLLAVFASIHDSSQKLLQRIKSQRQTILGRMKIKMVAKGEAEDAIRREIAELQQKAQALFEEKVALANEIDGEGMNAQSLGP